MEQNRRNRSQNSSDRVKSEFEERLVKINRVSRVLKGGRRFHFAALIIVGNKKGKVGFGCGRANDVSEAIRKGVEQAKKNVVTVPMTRTTIPHWVEGVADRAKVFLKPAAPGTGVIAGGPVRIVLEMAGVHDVLSKARGSRNTANMICATFDAIDQLLVASEVMEARKINRKQMWGEPA